MRLAHRFPRLRRGGSYLILLALLGFTAVGLSQCRVVEDNLTGVSASLARGGPAGCITVCARDYADSSRVEGELHAGNMRACEGDPVCGALETARHQQAVERIVAGRKQCMDDCRYQTGGVGGQ
jgi:hypothetical protein